MFVHYIFLYSFIQQRIVCEGTQIYKLKSENKKYVAFYLRNPR